LVIEVQCPGLSCGPWYAGNGDDGISYRVVPKGISGIREHAAGELAAATGVDEVANGSCRYIAARREESSRLEYPDVRRRSKLINLAGHGHVDVEPTQDVELIVED
jgi:hypothetical protein